MPTNRLELIWDKLEYFQMASMLSSFFSRDPRANFAYELPATSFHTENGISMGKSWKRVIIYKITILYHFYYAEYLSGSAKRTMYMFLGFIG